MLGSVPIPCPGASCGNVELREGAEGDGWRAASQELGHLSRSGRVPVTSCPKCGFRLEGQEECPRCGVIVRKASEHALRSGGSFRPSVGPPVRAASPAWRIPARTLAAAFLAVALGAVAMMAAWPREKEVWPAGANSPLGSLPGFYEEEQTSFEEGPFGLEFFGDGTVHVFMGGKKIGPPARYKVSGGKIRVHHACGVWEIAPKRGRLYHAEYGSYLRKKEG